MKFFERAAALASLGSINVNPSFQIASQDAKLKGQSQSNRAMMRRDDPLQSVYVNLVGPFVGIGFNTIFRPNSLGSGGTTFNTPVRSTNVLELNLMSESLNFANAIGATPNRGLDPQPDIFLQPLPYLQIINDVTNVQTGRADGTPSGIHFEPGLFVTVPATDQNPVLGTTTNRMASIPHGTTINAQVLEPPGTFPGGPFFAPVDLTPVKIGTNTKIRFPSQTASNASTARLPQDLSKFMQTGTITQAILDDPNTVLRQAVAGQKIDNTVVFNFATVPSAPITGGGTSNHAFLTGGNGSSVGPNALASQMNATFWISTVNWTVTVPVSKAGTTQTLTPVAPNPNVTLPTFSVTPPRDITTPTNITAQSTQIQYSQMVLLNFNGLSWPHVSVNTLTKQNTISVPASAFG